ncbi:MULTISPECIES: GNAT family N-acetyltransferase [Protofrankia]|uniref:Acetyltransferase n=1 Tax=Protofrankia coriariae TaxID=1562887 RepID=A0ABR5F303_9ACTN|nr:MULTISPECIES: GNAT family N-acetyltransferase [Protofrankia]KLL11094.1 acetyltransferase [Protofrankia coriariae]ONH34673.1 GNAT family N-acetyltransferase [Protofrankia sp. BMG5.30]
MVEVEVLTAHDWPRWRELRLAALAAVPYAFGARLADWQGDGDREERWRARLSIPGSCNFHAVLDGKPAGIVSGVPSPRNGVVELISLWVSEEAWGQGVGDRLVRAVEQWAVQGRAEVLQLAVSPGNKYAIALYRRHGFADTGQFGDVLPGGGREHIMAKRLPPAELDE